MSLRFKKFRVYNEAKEFLTYCTFTINQSIKKKSPNLADQIERAAISIILNIAEGSGGESDKEFSRFISISIKSTYEVIAGFDIAYTLKLINQNQLSDIENKAEIIIKELCSFRKTLKAKS